MIADMTGYGLSIFQTAIGPCGIAWGPRGVVAVQLPRGDAGATRAQLRKRCPDANDRPPHPDVARAIAEITQHLSGAPRDLSGIVIDDSDIPAFNRRVYAIVRRIPAGQTMTYGEIAERLGDKLLARDVGQAMGENPTPIIMPCHRVLAAGGKLGGFSAPGGSATKMRLLAIEGAQPGGPTLFDSLPPPAQTRRRA